jgi:hypothetical protein
VEDIGDKVEDIGDKVQCVDEKVQVVIDRCNEGVSNRSPIPLTFYLDGKQATVAARKQN